jgi:hypothetical protein
MSMRYLFALLVLCFPAIGSNSGELDGPAILARATAAAGGVHWADAKSLILEGRAEYWGTEGSAPKSRSDSYMMYREFDPSRTLAHGADGKIRIISSNNGNVIWTVGFDGETTWNEKGVIPKAEADIFWANNMGFGIIRQADKPGFKAERVADGAQGRHGLYLVRLTDPKGGVTLFGIDRQSYAIRTMAFMTPRGWHERHYDDFVRLKNPDWLQARTVTLFYNGVKANTVYWRTVKVNAAIAPDIFKVPAELSAPE